MITMTRKCQLIRSAPTSVTGPMPNLLRKSYQCQLIRSAPTSVTEAVVVLLK